MNFCVCMNGVFWNLLLNIVIFILGTAILVKGSDLFVDAAAALARLWKVPELVIGLTLVSIGTSLPELASSIYASIQNAGDFTIGNIIGSNVTNIALILGIGLIGAGTLPFQKKMVLRDGGIMLAVYAITVLMFCLTWIPVGKAKFTNGLNAVDGVILLIFCALYTWLLFRNGDTSEENKTENKNASILKQLMLVILGIVMITIGSKAMVDPVVWAANKIGISMLVISSTIVAFGTSVPELAVTIAGVVKKQHDIAYGNIIGSNIFNILLIFGVTSCINPLHLNLFSGIGVFNLISMIVVASVLVGMMAFSKKRQLTRMHGIILLLMYAFYLFWNCRDAFRGTL